MSGEPRPATGGRSGAAREAVRARLVRLRGSRQRAVLGTAEIVGLGVACLLLLAAVFSYFYFLVPERSRLERAGQDRAKLQSELRVSTEGIKRSESTQASVEEIINSLQDFEDKYLIPRNEVAVIEELNGLIRRNGLRISTGVSFTQFDEATRGAPQQQRAAAGTVKALQNVFPGVGVSLTVEGQYTNLRRFIRDVEADRRRFVVINSVELEGVTDAGPARAAAAPVATMPGAAPVNPQPRGALVSLRLDMAAFFRRTQQQAASDQTPQP